MPAGPLGIWSHTRGMSCTQPPWPAATSQYERQMPVAPSVNPRQCNECGLGVASKHAVAGLVKCLALDFGHLGIRANAVCPGNVRTPMMDAYLRDNPQEEQYWNDAVPLRRMADPDEIADVVAFLASPDASYVNGTLYLADGGGSAGSFTPDRTTTTGVPA